MPDCPTGVDRCGRRNSRHLWEKSSKQGLGRSRQSRTQFKDAKMIFPHFSFEIDKLTFEKKLKKNVPAI